MITTTEKTAAIRKQYKVEGIKASVRASHGSIEVRVKSGNYKRAEEIAKGHQRVDRCEMTGEILSGGNTFVFVEWADSVLSAKKEEIRAAFAPMIASLDERFGERINGWSVVRCSRYDYRVESPAGEDRLAWGPDAALTLVARMMLEAA